MHNPTMILENHIEAEHENDTYTMYSLPYHPFMRLVDVLKDYIYLYVIDRATNDIKCEKVNISFYNS
jgi:hypothetical protein